MSFEDFLKSRGLTPNLVQFIIYSISSVPAGAPFREVSPSKGLLPQKHTSTAYVCVEWDCEILYTVALFNLYLGETFNARGPCGTEGLMLLVVLCVLHLRNVTLHLFLPTTNLFTQCNVTSGQCCYGSVWTLCLL